MLCKLLFPVQLFSEPTLVLPFFYSGQNDKWILKSQSSGSETVLLQNFIYCLLEHIIHANLGNQ